VLAKDAVASLARWSARDTMGQMLRASQQELAVVDDRTFRWVLRAPYPRMLLALGKANTPCAFIMPERIASTDPFSQITEYIGSGPTRFVREEWVPGAQAVFARNADYRPREEPSSWLAGGKRMLVDRVEWHVIPDGGTASGSLQTGEVDWWETPLPDLVPLLKKDPRLRVEIADPLGHIGSFRMNHLQPPFDDKLARHAVLAALDQQDYMEALVGDDPTLWRRLPGFFTPGTPLYTEAGGDMLKGKRDLDLAKKLLGQSRYAGQPVTCLVAQDMPLIKPQGDVTADLLARIGFNVDFVATDWATVGARRAAKTAPGHGGWSMFHTEHAGADCLNPAGYFAIRANGEAAWFGWPTSAPVEDARDAWFGATDPAAERAAVDRLNTAAMEDVVFAPTGFFLAHQAWRKAVSGIRPGPMPFFWGVEKA
jgi:peptide/nickel transport system substrate-binding protein